MINFTNLPKGALHGMIFAAGTLVGATTTAIILCIRNKTMREENKQLNDYADTLEKEINEFAETNKQLTDGYRIVSENSESYKNEMAKLSAVMDKYGENSFVNPKTDRGDTMTEQGSVKIDPTDEGEEADYLDELPEIDPGEAENDFRAPYVITGTEYINGHPEYSKVSAMYFMDDHVLVDADSEEQIDIDFTVGAEAVSGFSTNRMRPETRYVRCEDEMTDYEIVKMSGSFDEYLGLDET